MRTEIYLNLTVALTLVLAMGGAPEAQALTSLSGSAASLAEAGAVVARAGNPEALLVNPAAASGGDSWELELGAMALKQGGSYASGGGWSGNGPERISPVPSCYGIMPLCENWTIGVGISSPYRRWVAWPDELADSLAVTTGEFSTAVLAAAVAWNLSPHVSLGIGLEFLHGGVLVKSGYWDLPEDPASHGRAEFDADGIGTGMTIGFLWRLSERTALGVALAEASPLGAEGRGVFQVPLDQSASYPGGDTHVALEAPATFRLGVSHRPMPAWIIEMDAEWRGSSKLKDIEFELAAEETVWTWDIGWRDAITFRAGTNLAVNSWLRIHAGYAWERTLDSGSGPSSLLPGRGEQTAAFGLGVDHDPYRVNIAVARSSREGCSAGEPDFPLGTMSSRALAIALSVGYRFSRGPR